MTGPLKPVCVMSKMPFVSNADSLIFILVDGIEIPDKSLNKLFFVLNVNKHYF